MLKLNCKNTLIRLEDIMSKGKYGRLINPIREGAKILDQTVRPVAASNASELPIKRFVTLEKEMVDETNFYQAIHLAEGLVGEQPEIQVYHSHEDFDESYLFLGKGKDFKGLKAQVILEGETHVIDSPASVYIPRNVKHMYKMLEGTGILIVTINKGKYGHAKK